MYARAYSDRPEKCGNVEEGIRHLSLSLMLICASALQMSHPIRREKSHQPCLIAHIHDGALRIDCSIEICDGKREDDFINTNVYGEDVKVGLPHIV